mmetsp:Transcript_14430/g.21685  ORF Transcript_14430/g.21685 Transcript_14430/m.21685 type:complete len:370 (-) Transcript_14430:94-1203(-)|eukprot:CAMPEP_0185027490 /NCGR_PEP_ID=MMETSP1103-20130426/12601_1 /TAXON_ID=36769 /ORGANISM="Paraphysomonas bandaiensis, Strain Caron Lab Isolate" /LENGTH=369 /DNA_ID=CAMNT_0027561515 /DNA_START=60 /DNA_END=1169 /DNA_ORIENTATION=-
MQLIGLLLQIAYFYLTIVNVCGYDAFRDGYFNDVLPGGPGDDRNTPNLPFTTDTNRLSDGVTSTAVADVTSPHFPIYNGSLSNTTERYKFYVNYQRSAAEQGIGILGVGDSVIEDAKVKITRLKNYTSLPKPSADFKVYAAIKWNPSNFALQTGEYYRVEVVGSHHGFGDQFWNDGGIRVDAEGYEAFYDAISNCYVAVGRCRPHLKKRRRFPEANWMALMCAIGDFVRPLTIVAPGFESEARYLPLDESRLQETIFHVGHEFEFRANNTGQLICFANDAHTLYWNNIGDLDVRVTRMSWPPTSETYYQALYNEACDSARAVYKHMGNWSEIDCNPDGGGSGWVMDDVLNTITRYTSGMPDDFVGDLER